MAYKILLSHVHSKISNRPAYAFCGITVTEFWKTDRISTRFSTLRAVRLLCRPGLVAALTQKHNTRAGSSRIGTKENPFAVLNFTTELTADDLNKRGSNTNWRECVRCGATGDTGRPASGSGDRPSRSFVLILSCSRERDDRVNGRASELDGCSAAPDPRVAFGRARYFQRAGGRHAEGSRPRATLRRAGSVRTWSANGIAQRTDADRTHCPRTLHT